MNTNVRPIGRARQLAVVLSVSIGVLVVSGSCGRHVVAQQALVRELQNKLAKSDEAFRRIAIENEHLKQMLGFDATMSFDDVKKTYEKDMEACKLDHDLAADQLDYRSLLDWARAEMESLNAIVETLKKQGQGYRDALEARDETPRDQRGAGRKADDRAQQDMASLTKRFAAERNQLLQEKEKLQERLALVQQQLVERSRMHANEIAKLQAQLAGQPPRPPGAEPDRPARSAAVSRTWTDATGRFSLEAALLEVKDGKAVLQRANGQVVRVPVAKLSKADRNYLASLDDRAP